MGASDYMVGNAPAGASYSAPLVGQQLGETIGNYPKDYFEGQQRQRQLAVMNAFPNGIPPGATVNDLMSTLSKAGGGQYVQSLMPFLLQSEQGQKFSQGVSDLDTYVNGGAPGMPTPIAPGARSAAPAPQNAASPTNLQPQPQATPQSQPTVMKILAAQNIPNDQLQAASDMVARQLGVSPTDPINPQDPQVRNVLGPAIMQLKRMNLGQVVSPQQPQRQPSAPAGQPDQAAPGPQVAQNAPPANAQQAAAQNDEGVPGADEATMKRLAFAAGRLRAAAAGMATTNPAQAQALENQAKAYDDRAKQIFDTMAASRKQEYEHELGSKDLTPEEKNARANNQPSPLANERVTEQQKALVASRGKRADAFITAGDTAEKALPMTEYALTLANSPNFIAGAGKGFQDAIANVGQTLGLGQSASIGQIFDKLRSETILNGIRSMAGTGPVRVAEMNVIEKASGDRANQAEAVRAVLIMQQRAYQKQLAIKNVIAQHKGILDDDAQAQIDQIMAKPLFQPAELKDPHALGAPTVAPQDVARHVLYGHPFRTLDGRIRYNWQQPPQQPQQQQQPAR